MKPIPSIRSFSVSLLLVIVVALLPVVAVFTLESSEGFTALVAAAYVLELAILSIVLLRQGASPPSGWVLVAIAVGISQALTLIVAVSTYGDYNLFDLVSLVAKVLGVGLFAGAASRIKFHESHLDLFLRGFLALAVLAMLYNLASNWSQLPGVMSASSSYQVSFRSFFANRNQFGHFIFLSLLVHFLSLRGRPLLPWNWFLFALQGLSLVLTMSRSAMVASAVTVAVLLITRARFRLVRIALLAALAVVLAVTATTDGVGSSAVRLLVRPEEGLSGREQLWDAGIDLWLGTSWLFGVGGFRGVEVAQAAGMSHTEFHSFFVETLVSGGLAELTLVMLIVVYCWRRLARPTVSPDVRYAYSAAYVGLFVLACFESVSFFTIGLVGTLFTLMFVTLPLLLSNGFASSGVLSTPSSADSKASRA